MVKKGRYGRDWAAGLREGLLQLEIRVSGMEVVRKASELVAGSVRGSTW